MIGDGQGSYVFERPHKENQPRCSCEMQGENTLIPSASADEFAKGLGA
jgi:hypothetical protein